MGIHENLQPVVWATTIPFIVLTGLTCLVRFYGRFFIAKAFGMDDWFMFFSFWTWLATQAILKQMILFGGGKASELVPPQNIKKITLLLLIIEFVYIVTQWFIKMSFVFFYLRVLASTPTYRKWCYAAGALTCLQTIAVLLFYGLQCIPMDAFFNPLDHPKGSCVATPITLYIPASLNVLTDLVIYVLPIYPLWQLQMSRRRRLALIACFTVGGGTILVSLLRFIVLQELGTSSRTFYIYGKLDIVTTIELATAIITANMPAMRAVWKTHIGGSTIVTQTADSHVMGAYPPGASRSKNGVVLASRDADGKDIKNSSEEELWYPQHKDILVSKKVVVQSERVGHNAADKQNEQYYEFSTTGRES